MYNFLLVGVHRVLSSATLLVFACEGVLNEQRGIICKSCHPAALARIMFLLCSILRAAEVMLSLLRKAEGERGRGIKALDLPVPAIRMPM